MKLIDEISSSLVHYMNLLFSVLGLESRASMFIMDELIFWECGYFLIGHIVWDLFYELGIKSKMGFYKTEALKVRVM